jgi:hypothetical protein
MIAILAPARLILAAASQPGPRMPWQGDPRGPPGPSGVSARLR